jgi:ABC-2 type transport system permease protein
MGLLLGSFSESIKDMVKDNPTLSDYFATTGAEDIVDAFFATSLLLLAIGASGFAVSSALRTRFEESNGRLEPLLATAVSRPRWLAGSLLVTLGGTLVVVAAGGLGVGLSYSVTGGAASDIGRMTGLALAYVPATLVLAAVAVVLVGWVPRGSGAAWAGVAVCFVIGWLGGLLDLPGWVNDLSPFTHVPAVPSEDLVGTPLVVLGLLGVGAVAAGFVGFRRRDVG